MSMNSTTNCRRRVEFPSVQGTLVTAWLEDIHLEMYCNGEGNEYFEVHHGPTGRYWYVIDDVYDSLRKTMGGEK